MFLLIRAVLEENAYAIIDFSECFYSTTNSIYLADEKIEKLIGWQLLVIEIQYRLELPL